MKTFLRTIGSIDHIDWLSDEYKELFLILLDLKYGYIINIFDRSTKAFVSEKT